MDANLICKSKVYDLMVWAVLRQIMFNLPLWIVKINHVKFYPLFGYIHQWRQEKFHFQFCTVWFSTVIFFNSKTSTRARQFLAGLRLLSAQEAFESDSVRTHQGLNQRQLVRVRWTKFRAFQLSGYKVSEMLLSIAIRKFGSLYHVLEINVK